MNPKQSKRLEQLQREERRSRFYLCIQIFWVLALVSMTNACINVSYLSAHAKDSGLDLHWVEIAVGSSLLVFAASLSGIFWMLSAYCFSCCHSFSASRPVAETKKMIKVISFHLCAECVAKRKKKEGKEDEI